MRLDLDINEHIDIKNVLGTNNINIKNQSSIIEYLILCNLLIRALIYRAPKFLFLSILYYLVPQHFPLSDYSCF